MNAINAKRDEDGGGLRRFAKLIIDAREWLAGFWAAREQAYTKNAIDSTPRGAQVAFCASR